MTSISNIIEIVFVVAFVSIVVLHIMHLITACHRMRRVKRVMEIANRPTNTPASQSDIQDIIGASRLMERGEIQRRIAQSERAMHVSAGLYRVPEAHERHPTTLAEIERAYIARNSPQRTLTTAELNDAFAAIEAHNIHPAHTIDNLTGQTFTIQQSSEEARLRRMALNDREHIKKISEQAAKEEKDKLTKKPITKSILQHMQLGDE